MESSVEILARNLHVTRRGPGKATYPKSTYQ